MTHLIKFFEGFDRIISIISAFTLFIMMMWIFLDVTLRTIFNSPIQGTVELTGEYLMVILVYFPISSTHKNNGHVKVPLLEAKFPERLKSITRFITNILAIVIFLTIGILNFMTGIEHFERGIRSAGVLDYPLAPALMIISIGLFMISLRLIIDCISILFPRELKSSHHLSDSKKGFENTI